MIARNDNQYISVLCNFSHCFKYWFTEFLAYAFNIAFTVKIMPRYHKRKTNFGIMPLTTYEAAAKRVRKHKESYRKVAADFGVSAYGLAIASTNSHNGYLL